MSDSTQDPAATAGDETTNTTTEQTGDSSAPDNKIDANALAARLRKSDKELQKAQAELAKLKKAEAKKAEAEMTELEKLKASNTDLQTKFESAQSRFTESVKMGSLKLALKDAKVKSVEAALKLADTTSLEVDDEGNVTGAAATVKQLQKDFDFLFGSTTSGNAGGGNPGSGPPKTDPKDYANLKGADWADFQRRVMAGEEII